MIIGKQLVLDCATNFTRGFVKGCVGTFLIIAGVAVIANGLSNEQELF